MRMGCLSAQGEEEVLAAVENLDKDMPSPVGS